MNIGSHNSVSYKKPQWWMRPFRFMAQCQSLDIKDQTLYGVRLFDIRLDCRRSGTFMAHGLATYGVPDEHLSILNFLDHFAKIHNQTIYVRVLNERNRKEVLFERECNYINFRYQNLIFFGGRNKSGKQIFDFGNSEPNFIDKYSSCNHDFCKHDEGKCRYTGTILDDWFPRLYAKLFNKKWRNKYRDFDGFLMQDFVGKY